MDKVVPDHLHEESRNAAVMRTESGEGNSHVEAVNLTVAITGGIL